MASHEDKLVELGFSNPRLLGRGGFSSVYQATDVQLDRDVAIKMTDRVGREAAYSLLREAQAAARIEHPNVLPVYRAGVLDGDVVYMVMPLAHGDLDRMSPMTRDGVLDLGVRLSSALATLHAAGLVHGDVKPSNILILNGRPVLADFGLTAPIGDKSVRAFTPLYAAPEVLDAGEQSPASDVYSLALTLVHLLSEGLRATSIDKRIDVLVEVNTELRQLFPKEQVEQFMRALSHKPSQRPSARDFGLRLQEVQASLGDQVTPLELAGIKGPLARVEFSSPFSTDIDLMVLSLGAGNRTIIRAAEHVEALRSRRDAVRVLQSLSLGLLASLLGGGATFFASDRTGDVSQYGLAMVALIAIAGIVSIGSLTFRSFRLRRRATLAARAVTASARIRNAYAFELDGIRALVTQRAATGSEELSR